MSIFSNSDFFKIQFQISIVEFIVQNLHAYCSEILLSLLYRLKISGAVIIKSVNFILAPWQSLARVCVYPLTLILGYRLVTIKGERLGGDELL